MNRWLVIRLRQPNLSLRLDLRAVVIVAILGLLTAGVMVINIGLGEYPISPPDVVRALLGIGDETQRFVVQTLRVPRTLVAFLVGGGLAISGTILQGLARNPLAAPEIVGITAGANLAAVIVVVFITSISITILPFAAFAGALAVAAVIYVLAWKQGSTGSRLVLIGIGVGAIAHAVVTLALTEGDIYLVTKALTWMTGSVYGKTWEEFWLLLLWLAIFTPLAFLLSGQLNVLRLGDDVARGLGSRVEWERGLLLLTSVALTAGPVAVAGPIGYPFGFVGLMAPHIAGRLTGSAHSGTLAVAAMAGGLILVLSDLVGRVLFAPVEIPCGAIAAAVGAPYLIYLLYRSRNI
ncbi:MAG TPA: iron ABC transporter permease [Nitrolancea sp.]|nr:iron ABC transporter permease [Nitrolancea sp.]